MSELIELVRNGKLILIKATDDEVHWSQTGFDHRARAITTTCTLRQRTR